MSSPETAGSPRRWLSGLGAFAVAATLALGASTPAYGDPDVPDPGSRPEPGSSGTPGTPPQLPEIPDQPGTGQPGGPPAVEPPGKRVIGPLASQILSEQQAVELLGERLKDATAQLAALRKLRDSARDTYKSAEKIWARAKRHSANSVAAAYRERAAIPEDLRDYAPGLEHLAPGLRDRSTVESKAAAETYRLAAALAKDAKDALQAAQKAYQKAAKLVATLRAEFAARGKALEQLKQRNADALRQAQRAADRYANKIDFDPGSAVDGLRAHPKALKAVRYALAQLGKPYVWGDEGPDTFDCSGLVWAAYKYAGVNVGGRTARQQYYATPKVRANQMLPGDLVFFGPDKGNPESIHHVGLYIGKGRIVHAPTAGDVVKISPIWWWEFFGATRVVPAVKAPDKDKPDPKKPDPDKPDPDEPDPRPSWSTSPNPRPSGSKSPAPPSEPAPDDSQSASPDSEPKESPTSDPDQSGSADEPEPTPSPSAAESPTDSGTSSGASGPSSGGSASASPDNPDADTSPDDSDKACRSPSASDSPSPSASPTASGAPSPSATPAKSPAASASPAPEDCEVGDAGATEGTADWSGGESEPPHDWISLASSQKAAMIGSRRRTRAGSRSRTPRHD